MAVIDRRFLIVLDMATGTVRGIQRDDTHDNGRVEVLPVEPKDLVAALPNTAALVAEVDALKRALASAIEARDIASAELEAASARIAALEAAAPANGCSDLQGRLALKAAGKLAAAEALVSSLAVDDAARLYWDRALFWREDSPIIAQFAVALGISDSEKTALFAAARGIQV